MSEEMPGEDLSGAWTGFYIAPIARPPTAFEAEIRDNGGLLSGITTELGDTHDCRGMTLNAVIEGSREGGGVRFTKRYDYLPRAHYAIQYEGRIADGGDEIEGEWTIPGSWSGTFLMIRGAGKSAAIERRTSETV
jgi:hypothetical protein